MSEDSKVGRVEKLRLFVAIPLPLEVKKTMREAQGKLKSLLPVDSIAWTKADNLHLTLRFIGEASAEQVLEISRGIRQSLAGFGSMRLICERLGCFPHARFPRVVWAGVHDETGEQLEFLQRRIDEAVVAFAAKPAEERFVGHVSLARLKQIKRAEAEKLERFLDEAVAIRFGTWRADAVQLIRSELSPQGSRYTTLDVISLLL